MCGAMSYVPGQPVTAVVVRRDEPESGSGGRAAGGIRCGWRERVSAVPSRAQEWEEGAVAGSVPLFARWS